jgi:hypothetical protein
MSIGWLPFALKVEPCGSRVTCDPPPMHTDADFLALLPPGEISSEVDDTLTMAGWKVGGSEPGDTNHPLPPTLRFMSYTKGEVNIIITTSPDFYRRFMAATSVSKRLNLLHKPDRIALFQAVLYGNPCTGKRT